GPIAAPAKLRFALGGYAARPGNQIIARRIDTGATVPLAPVFDVGERWRIADFVLPDEWKGKPIVLVARDETKMPTGWLADSEPIRGGRGGGLAEFLDSLAAWSINGLLLSLPWFAALRWLSGREGIPTHWLPLAAAGVVAAAGYAAFWVYFWNA